MTAAEPGVSAFTVRQAAFERIFRQLHNQSHVGDGKLSHPRCKLCRQEYTPERINADTARRRQAGLL